MPNRVEKVSSVVKPTVNRKALAAFIREFGFEMPSCSACRNARPPRPCFVAEGSSTRCDACVSAGYTNCNVGGIDAAACECPSLLAFLFFLLILVTQLIV